MAQWSQRLRYGPGSMGTPQSTHTLCRGLLSVAALRCCLHVSVQYLRPGLATHRTQVGAAHWCHCRSHTTVVRCRWVFWHVRLQYLRVRRCPTMVMGVSHQAHGCTGGLHTSHSWALGVAVGAWHWVQRRMTGVRT